MDIGLFILRAVVGLLFVAHGTQKLFGWFGGHGLQGTGGWLTSMGFRGGTMAAVGVGLAEAVGGSLLFLGLFTWLGAAMIMGVMVTAIVTVHLDKGMWNTSGGMEYPLTLVAAALAIAFTGPGLLSIDAAVGMSGPSLLSGLFAMSLAVLGAAVALSTRTVMPAPTEEVADTRDERRRAA